MSPSGSSASFSGRQVALLCWDSDVYLYAETMRFMAWKLRHDGFRVIRFGCASALHACVSITSGGLAADRDATCRRCRAAQSRIPADDVFDVAARDTTLAADAAAYLDNVGQSLAASGTISAVLPMTYAGHALCRIAFFDFSMVTKLTPECRLDKAAVERFMSAVADLLALLKAFQRFSLTHSPDVLLYINGNYSQHTLARAHFGAGKVGCFSVEPQLTSQHALNRVMFMRDRFALHPQSLYPAFADSTEPASPSVRDFRGLLNNFGARIHGSDFNAYTSLDASAEVARELRDLDGFMKSHRRVHSFFLSSEDELTPHVVTHGFSADGNQGLGSYRSQFDFTAHLIREASRHPEVGFVIRLHPRMAANKRDHFESPEHIRYRTLLADTGIARNVKVLFGDSAVSSYYLIARSDMVLVSWSTIGLEALLLGAPVVSAFPRYLMYPLGSLARQPGDAEAFEQAVFAASDFGVPRDDQLVSWMCNAYEGQFLPTAAPRARGGLPGKLYRTLYRVARYPLAYDLVARLINRVFLGSVTVTQAHIACARGPSSSRSGRDMHRPLRMLQHYRSGKRAVLRAYGTAAGVDAGS